MLELELEREEREKERERELQREKEEREFRLIELQKAREIELKKLEIQSKTSHPSSDIKFDVTKHIKMVPPFQEKDVDQYFFTF